MISWKDEDFFKKNGKTTIAAKTFEDTYNIIREQVKVRRLISYSELMDELKKKNNRKIHRGIIGNILGHISDQVSLITNPSVYPSSIVVHKSTSDTGIGFWTLEEGTFPPHKIPVNNRKRSLSAYQKDVFEKVW